MPTFHFTHSFSSISRRVLSALLATSILLSACGGGGGGAPGATPTPTPPATPTPPVPTLPQVWGTATLIESNDVGDVYDPRIAVNASGSAVAVWLQSDGIRDNVWTNRYTPSSGWGTATLIELDNADDAQEPQVAIDASGNAIAVWYQSDGTRENVWVNRYTPAGGWGTAALLETDDAGTAYNPQIAIDASGNAIAVWSQFTGVIGAQRYKILTKRFTPAGGWGTVASIDIDNGMAALEPQIAFDASGNAIAVWSQRHVSAGDNVWANRYTPTGGWGTAALIETNTSGSAGELQIAVNASGQAMAVWARRVSGVDSIWANRYTPSAGWGSAELLEGLSGDAGAPQVALDAAGNAIAVWSQVDGPVSIWASRFTPAGGWGAADVLETSGDNAGSPQIAIDPSGNAMVVWTQLASMANSIFARRYTPAGGWGTPSLLETDNGNSAFSPQIAMDPSGNTLAVWTQYNVSRTDIWANVYR